MGLYFIRFVAYFHNIKFLVVYNSRSKHKQFDKHIGLHKRYLDESIKIREVYDKIGVGKNMPSLDNNGLR